MTIKTFGGILVFALFALFTLSMASAQACNVYTSHGWQPDYDCDGVFDRIDTCPAIANKEQTDKDNNGIGDACDLAIQEVRVYPDNRLEQGEFAHLIVRVINNNHEQLKDVKVAVSNNALDVQDVHALPVIPAGETAKIDFWINVPECANPGTYVFKVSSSHKYGAENAEYSVQLNPSGLCGTGTGPLDTSVINVFGKVDTDREQSTVIPIRIINRGEKEVTYNARLANADGFTWRVDPAASMALSPNHEGTLYLYLQTDASTPAGSSELDLSITAGTQTTSIPVDVYVRGTKDASTTFWKVAKLFLILLLMLFIGIIGIIVVGYLDRKIHERKVNQ
ncbi:MAG: thrombospondin type 3 repeat-containing protein [Candidatus Woesearchaeota archaeon]|nr:thrombospondin type 3 repeat-containing protein [Candidatus Woesearchaeota archaeon]